jgi:serine protease
MHYPQCNGGGDWSLALTDSDRLGAACIYGAASGFATPLPAGCPGLVPPEEGATQTKRFADQVVAATERKDYEAFAVKPGTRIEVVMRANGASAGDPDLYVRFGRKPMRTNGRFDCRPFLTGADEACALDVPALAPDKRKAFVMIYGYAAGSYSLEVQHTPPE